MSPQTMMKIAVILMAANVAGIIWTLILWEMGRV
jgi:hypothetical protein